MTAPAGLARSLSPLSAAPFAALSPPLSEPELPAPPRPVAGGRLCFFGKDGHVLLELSHGPSQPRERTSRWTAVSRKPFWPPVTVSAPVGAIDPLKASVRSPVSRRAAGRKQPRPGQRPAGVLFCRGSSRHRRLAAPSSGSASTVVCPRRLGRRPCRAALPASSAAVPGVKRTARRVKRLADAVRRLAERGEQRAAPRRRCPPAAAVAAARPAASPAACSPRRSPSVHSIDSLLASPGRPAAAPLAVPPPPHLPPPPPPPPALYYSEPWRLGLCGGGAPPFRSARPSPAHTSSGWCAVPLDFSRSCDEPLNLSMR